VAKAYVFMEYGGPDKERFAEIPRPVPTEGELLISVKAAGVNPVDWKIREGLLAGSLSLQLPAVLGREAAGVVEEIGRDVSGFEIGDSVLGAARSGGYAESSLIAASSCVLKPPELSFVSASCLTVAGTSAYDGIAQLGLEQGETLLITGVGGGIGLIAAQLAVAQGARVVGTASAEKKMILESLGITYVPYGDDVADRLRARTEGRLDAVYDLVGGDPLRQIAGLLHNGTRLVSAADPATAAELGGSRLEHGSPREALETLAAAVASGKLDLCVTAVFPFTEAPRALRSVEAGHATGKTAITMD
jgi:NADPH:quinone reductase-like Zn-dependent oxidoreductase